MVMLLTVMVGWAEDVGLDRVLQEVERSVICEGY